MNEPIRIRNATADDAAAIATIQCIGVKEVYHGKIPLEYSDMPVTQFRIDKWKGWINRSRVETVVAQIGDEVIGFSTLQPLKEEGVECEVADITATYVLPQYWRQKVGKQLCDAIVDLAEQKGLSEISLWELEGNDAAQSFHQAMGFREDGARRIFMELPESNLYELRYRMSL